MDSRLIIDRTNVIDTVLAYTTAIDTRDWQGFGDVFTAEAIWEYQATLERRTGPEAIVARIRPSIEILDATQHLVSNHVVDIEGDRATHTCYYQAHHLRSGQRFVSGGRYLDQLRRASDTWLITQRTLITIWTEGDPTILQP